GDCLRRECSLDSPTFTGIHCTVAGAGVSTRDATQAAEIVIPSSAAKRENFSTNSLLAAMTPFIPGPAFVK
ncbi:MAG: hypothetical protein N2C14_31085, partial [Planctomycetales bacterium]